MVDGLWWLDQKSNAQNAVRSNHSSAALFRLFCHIRTTVLIGTQITVTCYIMYSIVTEILPKLW